MAGFTPIRITKNDKKEYARLVRNTKAKIRRTKKNHGIDLSNEITTPSLESFTTRKQYNEWKEKQRSFTNRANQRYQFETNKYGFTASKKEISQMERMTKQAQRKSDRLINELSKLPSMKNNKEKGTVAERAVQIGKTNATGITRPPKFDFGKIENRSHFERKKQSLETRLDTGFYAKKAETMKGNFIQKLQETFNSDADDVARKLEQMDNTDFYELYIMNKDDIDFDYLYTEDTTQNRDFVNKIDDIVTGFDNGQTNMDLKGF